MLEKVTVLRTQDFPQNSVKENIKENISSCGRQRLSAASALDAYKRKKMGVQSGLATSLLQGRTLTFLCSSHTIATEPTCSGPSRDSYLGSRIDCRQKIRGYGTRQLSSWGQSAILEGVPLEILAAGSPVWLLISSPSG